MQASAPTMQCVVSFQPSGVLLQIEKYGYSNPLKGKTIYNFGDSISNGQGNLVGDKRLGPAELALYLLA